MATSKQRPGYAIGDVIAGPMLAHKAEDEGVALAEMLAGQTGDIDYNLIPGVVYTAPEIVSVGKQKSTLPRDSIILASSRSWPMDARAMNATEGFVKILACAKSDKVLGCHIVGRAGTLVAEVVIAMEFGASAEDIALPCTPYARRSNQRGGSGRGNVLSI